MRICIVGNSHIVCLKNALALNESVLSAGASYLFAPGQELEIDIREGLLIPNAARALMALPPNCAEEGVRIGAQDAFVLVGIGVTPLLLVRLYREWRLFRHATPDCRLMSDALF